MNKLIPALLILLSLPSGASASPTLAALERTASQSDAGPLFDGSRAAGKLALAEPLAEAGSIARTPSTPEAAPVSVKEKGEPGKKTSLWGDILGGSVLLAGAVIGGVKYGALGAIAGIMAVMVLIFLIALPIAYFMYAEPSKRGKRPRTFSPKKLNKDRGLK